jgi:hypothetical protein
LIDAISPRAAEAWCKLCPWDSFVVLETTNMKKVEWLAAFGIILLLCAVSPVVADDGVTAVTAGDVLNSIGVCTHIGQGVDDPPQSTRPSVKVYDPTTGIAPTETLTDIHSVSLTLSDHPVVIEISFRYGPNTVG